MTPVIENATITRSKVFILLWKYCVKPSPTILMAASSTKMAENTKLAYSMLVFQLVR